MAVKADGCNSTTTVRVKISDDDFQDIIIDWSIHGINLNRSVIHQLAAFLGIQHTETIWIVGFIKDVGQYRAFVNPDGSPPCPWNVRMVLNQNNFFRDNDCYRVQLGPSLNFAGKSIFVQYSLYYENLINPNECNEIFCLTRGSRIFLTRLAKLLDSDNHARLENLPDHLKIRNNLPVTVNFSKELDILKYLDIGTIMKPACSARIHQLVGAKPRLYSPTHG